MKFTRHLFVIFLVAAHSCAALSPQEFLQVAKHKAVQLQQKITTKQVAALSAGLGATALMAVSYLFWRNQQPLLSRIVKPEFATQGLNAQLREQIKTSLMPYESELNQLGCTKETKPLKIVSNLFNRQKPPVICDLTTEEGLKSAYKALSAFIKPGKFPQVLAGWLSSKQDRETVLAYNKGKKAVNALATLKK